ncbi:hypothetical protein MSAN_02062400 [Mycena sanguinolenta]|uniref:Uncharacterized protein n=1 Tax=Mycena sanguinolenta TaxID=230812 RepID=A0A8H6XJI9_9AGAR|nr:hypothetical protein MSAN_02062400 [Mycena sanguinolenta]
MVHCLLTLETQVSEWDRRACATHYTGKTVYSPTHLAGAMAFASRQAAVRRTLAKRFRRLWWQLTDKITRPAEAASSESSGIDEQDGQDLGLDGPNSDDKGAGTDGESNNRMKGDAVLVERAPVQGDDSDVDQEGSGSESSASDMAVRAAEMDELLALQTVSMSQFDDV